MGTLDEELSGTLDRAGDATLRGLDVGKINNAVHVTEASDLPDASGGVRTLEDNTAYMTHPTTFLSCWRILAVTQT